MATVKKAAVAKKTAAAKAATTPSGKKAAAGTKKAASSSSTSSAASGAPSSTAAKGSFQSQHSHLFVKQPRHYGVGQALPPKRDLTRFVKWPRYIRIQRQRAILNKRLKVPPAINQFSKALDKNQASTLFRLLAGYRPESRLEKNTRLKAAAEKELKGETSEPQKTAKPLFIKYGLNHVTDLIEQKKAKLVILAHDVDPIELVVWIPALCRKMNIPYCIVKGKARLGHLVYKRTTSVIAVTEMRREDQPKLEQIVNNVRVQFNENTTERRKWGGGIVGPKAQAVVKKRERAAAKEAAAKLG